MVRPRPREDDEGVLDLDVLDGSDDSSIVTDKLEDGAILLVSRFDWDDDEGAMARLMRGGDCIPHNEWVFQPQN